MTTITAPEEKPELKIALRPGAWWFIAVLVSYFIALFVATYPYCKTLTTSVPSLGDPLVHLWLLNWNKQCLLEGRSPAVCPDVQIPVGLPIALDPPLFLQTGLYIVASLVTDNDALAYNSIWVFGFLSTGLATAMLAWYVVRDRTCAWLAGLLAMLSTPMMLHARGHLDLMQIAAVPIFLLTWMRFVDRPTRGRALAAGACYLLVSASAHYLALLTPFPAAAYVVWGAWKAGRLGYWPWLKARTRWLLAFVLLTLPGLFLVFSNQLLAVAQGMSMTRPSSVFDLYDVPLWSYFVPTPLHLLGRWLPYHVYEHSRHIACLVECGSYLGVVTLVLMACAAAGRFRFSGTGSWWFVLLVLVILSLGTSIPIGNYHIGLPAGWLRAWFPPFQFIRVPSRFNLITCICTAVLAAAGLRQLFNYIPYRGARISLCGLLACLAVADLGNIPFLSIEVPSLPPIYQQLSHEGTKANLLEIPQFTSGGSTLGALAAYWQSKHGQRTSASYSGFRNVAYDNLINDSSPFNAFHFTNPNHLNNPDSLNFDINRNISFDDYVWLYTNTHKFDYIVLHETPQTSQGGDLRFGQLKEHLAFAEMLDDGERTVYDVKRLKPPSRPVMLCTQGFGERFGIKGLVFCMVDQSAKISVYNPWPKRPLQVAFEVKVMRKPRKVRLMDGDKVIAKWNLKPQPANHQLVTPLMRLPEGLHQLVLECDGKITPPSFISKLINSAPEPFSLIVSSVELLDEQELAAREGRTVR